MALQLKTAFLAYDRLDVAEVNCGGEWVCQIKSFSGVVKIFAREQARIKAAGGLKKKVANTASVDATGTPIPIPDMDDPWLLGSFEADLEFFIENILMGWKGLKDDDGMYVPYSQDTALQIFLDNGEPAKQLYRELLTFSLDGKNYVKAANTQAEEEGGN